MSGGVFVPYSAYWSTPFAKWQKDFSHLHSLKFAAWTAQRALEQRGIAVSAADHLILGTTIPQHSAFYGAPWVAAMIGAHDITGPTINQACATSVRCLADAMQAVQTGNSSCSLIVTADRTSNGPNIYYPAPDGPGGTGQNENWVLDNFNRDPNARLAMIGTAENVAERLAITREEQHEVVLMRFEQYKAALANDYAFQKRYMEFPFPVPDGRFARTRGHIQGDQGVTPTTAEKLADLKPVIEGKTVTFAAQTHPADGNAGIIVTTRDKARELSAKPEVTIELVATAEARTERGFMPLASVMSAKAVLAKAGLSLDDVQAVKTHNPFAVNDIAFARETGFPLERMNNYGCSLIYGHPQGPTGLRGVIELIEELVQRGGGLGLFHGCAAGDSGMAVLIRVS